MRGPLVGGGGMLSGGIDLGRTEISIAEGLGASVQAALDQVDHLDPPPAGEVTLDRARVGETRAAQTRATAPASASTSGSARPARSSCAAAASTSSSAASSASGARTTDIQPVGQFDLRRGRLVVLGQRIEFDEGSLQLVGNLDPQLHFVARTQSPATSPRSSPSRAASPRPRSPSPPSRRCPRTRCWRGCSSTAPPPTSRPSSSPSSPPRRPSSPAAAAPGILARLRGATGLDDLDIITQEDGSTAVRAGKYLEEQHLRRRADRHRGRQPRRDQPRRQRQGHRPRLGRLRRQHHARHLLRARLLNSRRKSLGTSLDFPSGRRTGYPTQSVSYSGAPHAPAPRLARRCAWSPLAAPGRRRRGQHLLLAPLRHRRAALQRLHRADRHPGQPHRGHAGGADRPDEGRGRQQPRRHLPDRRRRPHLARRPARACCSRSTPRSSTSASRRTCATPTATGSASRSARGSSSTPRTASRTRRRPTTRWPIPSGRAGSASARRRASTTCR